MRDGIVVEVVGRVVQACAIAIAEEDEGAGARKQHVGKILAAHHRVERRIDRGVSGNIPRDRDGMAGLVGMVDGDGIVAVIADRDFSAVRCGKAAADLPDAGFRLLAHTGVQRAHRAGKLRLLGNDIVGEAGIELGDGDDERGDRIGDARHDRLECRYHLRTDHDGIDRLVRQCGMAAAALDSDDELIGRRHDRARARAEGADRHARKIMHAVDLGNAETLHHAVFHHLVAAAAALFGRLEDDRDIAGEIARLGEILCRTEQHGRVAIMAAGVHLAPCGGCPGLAGGLLDRQRIHVGAKPDHSISRPPCPAPVYPPPMSGGSF
jgi:hypothetical protein